MHHLVVKYAKPLLDPKPSWCVSFALSTFQLHFVLSFPSFHRSSCCKYSQLMSFVHELAIYSQISFCAAVLSKILEIPEFCFAITFWIFRIKLGFFKSSEYFIEISQIIKRILFFYFRNYKIFQKFQNSFTN